LQAGTTPYDGVFSLTKVKDVAYLVNHLDLEEYLQAVLPYESVPGWPDEVQKALCIAVRSYGISKVLEQRALHAKSKLLVPYDIKNTNAHQIYRGHEKASVFKKIVNDTRGIVLSYKDKPILAMFDIACGGIIPAQKKGVHFDKAPYLERKYPCNYCKENQFYRWENTYTFDELEKGLKKEFPTLGKIQEITIGSHDKAGVAQTVRVKASHRWYNLTAARFRALFPDVRSLAFDLTRTGSKIVLRGKGYGHHMGLCQWGACFMVKQGWDYKKVLAFYYPNTKFMKLTRLP
jgi:stage II sporulation protein D